MIPRETLHYLAKHLRNRAKVLCSSEKLCIILQNIGVLVQKYCVRQRNFAYSHKAFAFFGKSTLLLWETLHLLAKYLCSLAKLFSGFSGEHKSFAKEHKIFEIIFPPFSFFPIITTGSFELVFDVSTCSVWPSPHGFRVYKRSDDSFFSTIPIRHPGPRTLWLAPLLRAASAAINPNYDPFHYS